MMDSAAMLMVKNPRAQNGVVVTSNLFGDIIGDEASVIPGGIGLLPSAQLRRHPRRSGSAMESTSRSTVSLLTARSPWFPDPVRLTRRVPGSAPDISGKAHC